MKVGDDLGGKGVIELGWDLSMCFSTYAHLC